jgi:hypothetical protein
MLSLLNHLIIMFELLALTPSQMNFFVFVANETGAVITLFSLRPTHVKVINESFNFEHFLTEWARFRPHLTNIFMFAKGILLR